MWERRADEISTNEAERQQLISRSESTVGETTSKKFPRKQKKKKEAKENWLTVARIIIVNISVNNRMHQINGFEFNSLSLLSFTFEENKI